MPTHTCPACGARVRTPGSMPPPEHPACRSWRWGHRGDRPLAVARLLACLAACAATLLTWQLGR